MSGNSWLSFHTYSGSRKNLIWHLFVLQDLSPRGLYREVSMEARLFCLTSSYVSISGSFLLTTLFL